MSSKSEQQSCPFSDAILALLLDGDRDVQLIQETGWQREVSAAELAEHRSECPICSRTIESARRLDGLLAASTELSIEDEIADDLLEQARHAAQPLVVDQELAPSRGLRRQLVGVCLLVLGFLAGSLVWQRPENSASEEEARFFDRSQAVAADGSPAGIDAGSEPVLEPGMILVPDSARVRRRSRDHAPELDPRDSLEILRVADLLEPAAGLFRELAHGSRVVQFGRVADRVDRVLEQVRMQSIQQVLNSDADPAKGMVLACMADWAEGRGLRLMLSEARQQNSLSKYLSRRLAREYEDAALLRAATRLGGREIDRQLVLIVADQPEVGDRIARDLASISSRPGRETLLLDLWEAAERRDKKVDELTRARRWFTPLPQESSRALLDEFHQSRRADRRRHCLLAISAGRDSLLSEELRMIVDGSRHQESELAAFALGQIADGSDFLYRELEWSRRPHLLLAALACRQDARLAHTLAKMELSEAEQKFLAAGNFTPEQFAIVASLFRQQFRQQWDLAGL